LCVSLCTLIFAALKGEFSSAGSEHLPYKQRVGGSNPSTPTQYRQGFQAIETLFYFGWFKHGLNNICYIGFLPPFIEKLLNEPD
jgi:hypothetical protein